MAATLASGFLDRTSEREVLDRLLANVRGGQSAVLVMRGEAGIGKTALLRYAARQASGFRVAQVTGVEAEMELPFAGIHQLCAPLLDQLDALPQPQQDALAVALGLASGDVPDRFVVGLAVLGLLSAAAEERPLLCLVEDAHWLDAASGLILGFVARRLLAESLAIVVTVREPSTRHDFDGVPELPLRGLAEEDARTLLMSAVAGRLDDRVRDRIVAETRGNPLALLDLPRSMSAAELAGGFELLPATDLPGHLEEQYHQRAGELPEATQRLLLMAAAEPLGDARRSSGRRLRGSASIGARSPRQKTRSWSRSGPVSASGILSCDPRYTGPPPFPSGELRIGRWRRRPIQTPIPIAAPGIALTRRSVSTRTWPPSWSARPTGRGPVGARRPLRRSWRTRRS
jgi:AAA ATPase domain